MKTSQLRKRCVEAGVDESALEEADDAADSHAALVELLVAHEQSGATGRGKKHELSPEQDASEETSVALRSELAAMRLTALQKRATSEGVDADAVDVGMDGDDPKASLISLIVEAASRRGPAERAGAAGDEHHAGGVLVERRLQEAHCHLRSRSTRRGPGRACRGRR